MPIITVFIYSNGIAMEFISTPDDRVHLNDLILPNPSFSYFVRVEGDSMNKAGIFDGSLLVVDRTINPNDGDIVIANYQGDLVVKRLQMNPPALLPESSNPIYKPLPITSEEQGEDQRPFGVFGVVTSSVTSLR